MKAKVEINRVNDTLFEITVDGKVHDTAPTHEEAIIKRGRAISSAHQSQLAGEIFTLRKQLANATKGIEILRETITGYHHHIGELEKAYRKITL